MSRHYRRREGRIGRHPWRHYLVIADRQVTIIDAQPAFLGGWRFVGCEVQGPSDWGSLTADQIVAWKERAGHDLAPCEPHEIAALDDFLAGK